MSQCKLLFHAKHLDFILRHPEQSAGRAEELLPNADVPGALSYDDDPADLRQIFTHDYGVSAGNGDFRLFAGG